MIINDVKVGVLRTHPICEPTDTRKFDTDIDISMGGLLNF